MSDEKQKPAPTPEDFSWVGPLIIAVNEKEIARLKEEIRKVNAQIEALNKH